MQFEPRLPQHSREVQVTGALRAAHKKTFGRQNIFNQIQFSRVEKHSDHWRAAYWCFALPQSWPTAAGDCTIEIRGNATPAATLYEVTLKDATIVTAPGEAMHMYSYHTVTIQGGELATVTAPA